MMIWFLKQFNLPFLNFLYNLEQDNSIVIFVSFARFFTNFLNPLSSYLYWLFWKIKIFIAIRVWKFFNLILKVNTNWKKVFFLIQLKTETTKKMYIHIAYEMFCFSFSTWLFSSFFTFNKQYTYKNLALIAFEKIYICIKEWEILNNKTEINVSRGVLKISIFSITSKLTEFWKIFKLFIKL